MTRSMTTAGYARFTAPMKVHSSFAHDMIEGSVRSAFRKADGEWMYVVEEDKPLPGRLYIFSGDELELLECS